MAAAPRVISESVLCVCFMSIKVLTKIDADMTLEEKQAFLAEIDHRCPVSENLQNTTPLVLELEE